MKTFTIHKMLTAIILAVAIVTVGCTANDPESALQQAETDMQSGEIDRVASSCDLLCDSATTSLSSTQLCRVAILYAKISEKCDKADYMAAAAKCYDRAVGLSSDSIESYIESLNIEDQSYVRVIREVSRTLSAPIDISREFEDEECCDSLHSADEHIGVKEFSSKSTASL